MEDSPTKNSTFIRYTPEKKAEVLQFIREYNAEHKRGGQKVASAKFHISQLTLGNWMRNKSVVKKVRAPKTPKRAGLELSNVECSRVFAQLSDLHQQIDMLEKQVERLASLRAEAAALYAKIR